jgi:hypothetical protein
MERVMHRKVLCAWALLFATSTSAATIGMRWVANPEDSLGVGTSLVQIEVSLLAGEGLSGVVSEVPCNGGIALV